MHPLLRKTFTEIARLPPRVNLASVASSSRRVFNVNHLHSNVPSQDGSGEKLAGLAQDGIPTSLDPAAAGPSTVVDSEIAAVSTPTEEAHSDKQPPRTRRARPPPLRKRVICVDNVVDGTSLRKLRDLMSREFGDVAWVSLGRFAKDESPDKGEDRPELRQAYVLFKDASSIDKVRARLGSLIDFDGVALRAELIPPVAVGGPTNAELRDRLYPRKEPLHPVGVRPKDTIFVRRLEDEDVEELRKHIEASFSDLVSLTRLGFCLELRFTDVKAASRARTALKDHFRRSNSSSWVDFKTDEGDLPVVWAV